MTDLKDTKIHNSNSFKVIDALIVAVIILLVGLVGLAAYKKVNGTNLTRLEPAAPDKAQCEGNYLSDDSIYAQVAINNSSCNDVVSLANAADIAKGSAFTDVGFKCTAIKEQGAGSKWSTSWTGTFYNYYCVKAKQQIAFNWGSGANYTDGNPTSSLSNQEVNGMLQPAKVGDGDCQAETLPSSTVYTMIDVSNVSLCSVVPTVALGAVNAAGANYKADGYSCTGTKEGTGSEWASAWNGKYYAYSCKDGPNQMAFNFGPVNNYIYGESQ